MIGKRIKRKYFLESKNVFLVVMKAIIINMNIKIYVIKNVPLELIQMIIIYVK